MNVEPRSTTAPHAGTTPLGWCAIPLRVLTSPEFIWDQRGSTDLATESLRGHVVSHAKGVGPYTHAGFVLGSVGWGLVPKMNAADEGAFVCS